MVVSKFRESMPEVDGRVAVPSFQRDDFRTALSGTAPVDDLLQMPGWTNAEEGTLTGCVGRRRGRLNYEIISVTQF